MSVAVNIHPDGRGSVQVLFAVGVNEVGALPSCDNEGFLLLPFLHLGEGMPEVPMIPLLQLPSRGCSRHNRLRGEAIACQSSAANHENRQEIVMPIDI